MGEPEGVWPLRAPDRSRRGGMGDTARFGGVRASYRVALHGARGLRWRTQSNSDNNGMRREAGGQVSPGSPAHTERAESALGVARLRSGRISGRRRVDFGHVGSPPDELDDGPIHIGAEIREGGAICIRPDTDHDVRRHIEWNEAHSGELAQAAFELIPRHCGVTVPRDDEPDTCAATRRTHERGSDCPNL
jgi:hypothetical protein